MVEEILSNAIVEMVAVLATHVVWVVDIHHEVGIGIFLDRVLEELQRHLWHHCIVLIVVDDEQLALESFA